MKTKCPEYLYRDSNFSSLKRKNPLFSLVVSVFIVYFYAYIVCVCVWEQDSLKKNERRQSCNTAPRCVLKVE